MNILESIRNGIAILSVSVLLLLVIGLLTNPYPTKCTAPWKVLDKTMLPSALAQLAEKTGNVEATSPARYMQNKLVITMVCEPLGIYEIKVVSNP